MRVCMFVFHFPVFACVAADYGTNSDKRKTQRLLYIYIYTPAVCAFCLYLKFTQTLRSERL